MLRNKHLQESENRLKELKAIEPLHNKIENRYKQEYEIPELEKRKKILEDLRNLPYHTKTDIEDINTHSVQYEKLRKAKLDERIRNRMDVIKSHSNYSISQHKTKTFETMAMRDEMQQSLEEEKKQERIRLQSNKKNYSKNVLDLHKPSVSKRKQEEMRAIIQEVNRSPTQKVNRIKYERSEHSILNNLNYRSINGKRSDTQDDLSRLHTNML